MILTQPQEQRRDRLAYLALLRRLGPYSVRMAYTRSALVAVALLIDLCSTHRVLACLLTLPAAIGTLLHCLAIAASRIDSSHPLMRWYDDHLSRTKGVPKLSLPALAESVGAILLILAAAWAVPDLPPSVRLGYLAAAALYLCAVSCGIFDDNSWYDPAVRAPRWQEIDRILSGPQMGLLVLGIALWAPWETWPERASVVAIACWSFVVPLRLASTQHLTRDLGPLIEAERQYGTRLVIERTSSSLLPPLTEALELASQLGRSGEPVADLVSSAIQRVHNIPKQVAQSVRQADGDPLTTVADRLETLALAAGLSLDVVMPPALGLVEPDRNLASLAMRDLVGNAISAGAGQIGLTVRLLGLRMMVVVTDNGRPMREGVWKVPGTSSATLEQRLRERSGSLSVNTTGDAKTVTATWMVAA